MSEVKRVAILLPDLRGGGVERISVNLANGLVARGYSVDMVLMTAEGPFLESLSPMVQVVSLGVSRMRQILPPLIRYLRQVKPNVMLACMWPLTVLSLIARSVSMVATRVVVAEHNTWSASQSTYSLIHRLVIRKSMHILFPTADAVVAISNGAAEDLAKFAAIAPGTVTTIYNPVIDVSKDRTADEGSITFNRWQAAKYRLLTVGMLKVQKNHDLLLRSFALLCERMDAHLLILGEGDLRGSLEMLIAELGMAERVSMPGFVGEPAPYYRFAHLFVLSSDWEGLPTVLIEALGMGTAVVSTDCPSGPREILCDGRFGCLVPMRDAKALALAMEESLLKKHDARLLRSRGRDFSIDKAVDRYEKLLFPELMAVEGCG